MANTEDFSKYFDAEYFLRGLVKYTSRDYESIMKDFWEMVPKITALWKPEEVSSEDVWTPEANADPGVVLGKFLASIADMLGVNLDIRSSEMYAPSVKQRKDAERLFGLIGYELGWYTAARTEVTFVNTSDRVLRFDFGFNGSNFCTLNAYSDITGQSRVITYNILPLTNTYGATETRSRREVLTTNLNVFTDYDQVTLAPGEKVTRVAIEGELRSYTVSVETIKQNNYIIKIPSQHIDTTAVWIKAKSSRNADTFLATQWMQCSNPAEFVTPEPRFAVTYDSYSNAQIQISNYLDQLENYADNYLTVYWIDCSGVIGCVGEDVLSNYLQAKGFQLDEDELAYEESADFAIHNMSNTVELPHTNTVTGKSPETAKEAYRNSRNYINTWDSLVTLPDYTRFLKREPGVDCGIVLDCQKALEFNLSVFRDENLTENQKRKMYLTNMDFPAGDTTTDWAGMLDLQRNKLRTIHTVRNGQTLNDIASEYNVTLDQLISFNNISDMYMIQDGDQIRIPGSYDSEADRVFISNFKQYTAMCFAVHNDYKDTSWGLGQVSPVRVKNKLVFTQYKPPEQFCYNVIRDYRPLQSMSVDIDFGYLRVFPFYIVGQLYLKRPVVRDVGKTIIATVKEALALYFSPANREIGQKPTVMEVVKIIQQADSRIAYFDAGSLNNNVITYFNCDPEWFNCISIARLVDPGETSTNIRIATDSLID